ncbi:MAG: twin-arginine translocation signal domain-containing protein, partial [Candidatus Omnitrophica bacterium]|nr:twin-arginine translocation signal domain-containing protein [Candidatus Omnitrophota bacterium]
MRSAGPLDPRFFVLRFNGNSLSSTLPLFARTSMPVLQLEVAMNTNRREFLAGAAALTLAGTLTNTPPLFAEKKKYK